MGEVTLTPVFSAFQRSANHSQFGSTVQAENNLTSYLLKIEAAEQGLFFTVPVAMAMSLSTRKVCLRSSGLRN